MSRPAKRRIAAIFPGFGVGGAQVRYAALANYFGSACEHVILSLNGDRACQEKLGAGVAAEFPDPGHKPGHMLPAIIHAARLLRSLKPDVVLTSNWGAIEWAAGARLAGLRHVHSEDGFGPEERHTQIRRRVLVRRIALRGSQVMLPSRTLMRIATGIWKLPPRTLHYIPNGIDVQRFRDAEPAELPVGDGPVIGTVAALRPEKNLGRLLRATAALSQPAQLVIVGDGPERARLEAEAARLGLGARVFFAGHSQSAERYLAAFDIFALSSDTEQMPISLLEAMAAGLPAIATDVGDVRSMVSAENAPYIVPAQDDDFTAGLQRLLAANRVRIGQANQAVAQRDFAQDQMFAAWAGLLGI